MTMSRHCCQPMFFAMSTSRTRQCSTFPAIFLVLFFAICVQFSPSMASSAAVEGRSDLDGIEAADAIAFLALRPRRALDILESDDFGGLMRKRALDVMEGDGFSGFDKKKRALDMLDGDDFTGMGKRSVASGQSARLQRALSRLRAARHQPPSHVLLRARRALDALEGNAFGF